MDDIKAALSRVCPRLVARGDTSEVHGQSLFIRVCRSWMLYLLLTPTVIGMFIFQYYPAVIAFHGSFHSWDGRRKIYLGTFNYEYFFEDPQLLQAWRNVLTFLTFNTIITLTIPMIIAYLIYRIRNSRHQYLFRVAIIFPMIVPGFVFIVFWRWVLSWNGAINLILRGIGQDSLTRPWVGDPDTALYALIFMGFPFVDAISVLIYLAGFMSIPREIIGASIVDGASGWDRFRKIELPMVRGQAKVMVILTFIGTIQDFSRPLFVTKGGPGWATMVPGLRMYNAFKEEFDYGYASAIGVVLFAVIFVLTLFNQRFIKGGEMEGDV